MSNTQTAEMEIATRRAMANICRSHATTAAVKCPLAAPGIPTYTRPAGDAPWPWPPEKPKSPEARDLQEN